MLPVVNVVLPAVQSIAQTAAGLKRTMASWGLRRRSSRHEQPPEVLPPNQPPEQPPKPSSPPSQFLSLNRVANLLLEVVSSAGPSAVQRMPLTNVATLEAPFRQHIQYLVAARARQHERSEAHIERETLKRVLVAKRASDRWLRYTRARRSSSVAVAYSTPGANAGRDARASAPRPAKEQRQAWWKWGAAAPLAESTEDESGGDEARSPLARTPSRAEALQPPELSKGASPPSAIKAWWRDKWETAFADDASKAASPAPAPAAAAPSPGKPRRVRTDEEEEEALAARVAAVMNGDMIGDDELCFPRTPLTPRTPAKVPAPSPAAAPAVRSAEEGSRAPELERSENESGGGASPPGRGSPGVEHVRGSVYRAASEGYLADSKAALPSLREAEGSQAQALQGE